jgi:hypothetical protein
MRDAPDLFGYAIWSVKSPFSNRCVGPSCVCYGLSVTEPRFDFSPQGIGAWLVCWDSKSMGVPEAFGFET